MGKEGVVTANDMGISNANGNAAITNHDVAHAAILHNLALAYIALGDSNSSTPLLLRAAAIQRQIRASTEVLYWNLPHAILEMVEEKAWLVGAKIRRGEKQKRRRRIPFVPDTFTFEEMTQMDGI